MGLLFYAGRLVDDPPRAVQDTCRFDDHQIIAQASVGLFMHPFKANGIFEVYPAGVSIFDKSEIADEEDLIFIEPFYGDGLETLSQPERRRKARKIS